MMVIRVDSATRSLYLFWASRSETVARLLGHRSIKVIERLYAPRVKLGKNCSKPRCVESGLTRRTCETVVTTMVVRCWCRTEENGQQHRGKGHEAGQTSFDPETSIPAFVPNESR